MIGKDCLDFYLEKVFRQDPLTDKEFEELSLVLMRSAASFASLGTVKLYLLGAIFPGVCVGFYENDDAAKFLLGKLRAEGLGQAEMLPSEAPAEDQQAFLLRVTNGQLRQILLPAVIGADPFLESFFKTVESATGFNLVFVDQSAFTDASSAQMAAEGLAGAISNAPSAIWFTAIAPPAMSAEAVTATVMRAPSAPASRAQAAKPAPAPAAPPVPDQATRPGSIRPAQLAGKASSIQTPAVTFEEQVELLKPLTPPAGADDAFEEGMKTQLREPLSKDQLALLQQLDSFDTASVSTPSDSSEADLLSAVNVALGSSSEPAAAGSDTDSMSLDSGLEDSLASLLAGDIPGGPDSSDSNLLLGSSGGPDELLLGGSSAPDGLSFGSVAGSGSALGKDSGVADLFGPQLGMPELGGSDFDDLLGEPLETLPPALAAEPPPALAAEPPPAPVPTPKPAAPVAAAPPALTPPPKAVAAPTPKVAQHLTGKGVELSLEELDGLQSLLGSLDDLPSLGTPPATAPAAPPAAAPSAAASPDLAPPAPAATPAAKPLSPAPASKKADEYIPSFLQTVGDEELPPLEEEEPAEASLDDLGGLLKPKPQVSEFGDALDLPDDVRAALMEESSLDDSQVSAPIGTKASRDDDLLANVRELTLKRKKFDIMGLDETGGSELDALGQALGELPAEELAESEPEPPTAGAEREAGELEALDSLLGKKPAPKPEELAPDTRDTRNLTASLLELEDDEVAHDEEAAVRPGWVTKAVAAKPAPEPEPEPEPISEFEPEDEDEALAVSPSATLDDADYLPPELTGRPAPSPSLEPAAKFPPVAADELASPRLKMDLGLDEELGDLADLSELAELSEPEAAPDDLASVEPEAEEQPEDFTRLADLITGIISDGTSQAAHQAEPLRESFPAQPEPVEASDLEIESQIKELIVDELMIQPQVPALPEPLDQRLLLDTVSFEEPELTGGPPPASATLLFPEADAFQPPSMTSSMADETMALLEGPELGSFPPDEDTLETAPEMAFGEPAAGSPAPADGLPATLTLEELDELSTLPDLPLAEELPPAAEDEELTDLLLEPLPELSSESFEELLGDNDSAFEEFPAVAPEPFTQRATAPSPAPEPPPAPVSAASPEDITMELEALSELLPQVGGPQVPLPAPVEPNMALLMDQLDEPDEHPSEDALVESLEGELLQPEAASEPVPPPAQLDGQTSELDDLFQIDLSSLPPLPEEEEFLSLEAGPAPVPEPEFEAFVAPPQRPPVSPARPESLLPPRPAPVSPLAPEPIPSLMMELPEVILDQNPGDDYEDPLAGFATVNPQVAAPVEQPVPSAPIPPPPAPAAPASVLPPGDSEAMDSLDELLRSGTFEAIEDDLTRSDAAIHLESPTFSLFDSKPGEVHRDPIEAAGKLDLPPFEETEAEFELRLDELDAPTEPVPEPSVQAVATPKPVAKAAPPASELDFLLELEGLDAPDLVTPAEPEAAAHPVQAEQAFEPVLTAQASPALGLEARGLRLEDRLASPVDSSRHAMKTGGSGPEPATALLPPLELGGLAREEQDRPARTSTSSPLDDIFGTSSDAGFDLGPDEPVSAQGPEAAEPESRYDLEVPEVPGAGTEAPLPALQGLLDEIEDDLKLSVAPLAGLAPPSPAFEEAPEPAQPPRQAVREPEPEAPPAMPELPAEEPTEIPAADLLAGLDDFELEPPADTHEPSGEPPAEDSASEGAFDLDDFLASTPPAPPQDTGSIALDDLSQPWEMSEEAGASIESIALDEPDPAITPEAQPPAPVAAPPAELWEDFDFAASPAEPAVAETPIASTAFEVPPPVLPPVPVPEPAPEPALSKEVDFLEDILAEARVPASQASPHAPQASSPAPEPRPAPEPVSSTALAETPVPAAAPSKVHSDFLADLLAEDLGDVPLSSAPLCAAPVPEPPKAETPPRLAAPAFDPLADMLSDLGSFTGNLETQPPAARESANLEGPEAAARVKEIASSFPELFDELELTPAGEAGPPRAVETSIEAGAATPPAGRPEAAFTLEDILGEEETEDDLFADLAHPTSPAAGTDETSDLFDGLPEQPVPAEPLPFEEPDWEAELAELTAASASPSGEAPEFEAPTELPPQLPQEEPALEAALPDQPPSLEPVAAAPDEADWLGEEEPSPEPVAPEPAATAPRGRGPTSARAEAYASVELPRDLGRLTNRAADFPGIRSDLKEMWDNPESEIDVLLALAPKLADRAPGERSHQFIAGTLAQFQQHHSRAILYFERAIGLCQELHDHPNVTFVLEQMREILPGDPGVCQRLAEAYLWHNRKAEASLLWLEQGQRFLDSDSLSQAVAMFEQAHRLTPQDVDVVLGLASAYRADYNDLKALEIVNEALQAAPGNPRLMLGKALSLARIGRTRAAESCVLRALDSVWQDVSGLVWSYQRLGVAGLSTYQSRCRKRILELDPQNPAVSQGVHQPADDPATAGPWPGEAPAAPAPETDAGRSGAQGTRTAPESEPAEPEVASVALLAELRGRVPRFGKKIEALEFLDREVSTGSAPDARLAEVLRGYLSVAELFVQERPEDALDLYRRGESFVRQIHDKALRTTWAEEYQRELGRMRTRAN